VLEKLQRSAPVGNTARTSGPARFAKTPRGISAYKPTLYQCVLFASQQDPTRDAIGK